MTRRRPRREFFECDHCGADVPVGSKVCRECGSDAGTGWQSSEEIDYQSLDLPGGYADDSDPAGGAVNEQPKRWLLVTALVLAAVLVFAVLRGRF
jgi:hypothetical protein